MFDFVEIEDLKKKGYYMQSFEKEKQVFISHSSKDKKDVEMIIPYLNGQDLPVWFDKYSIPVGASITEQVQREIEESDMVIFWVTDNFLNSNWCQMEMKAYISRMIQENIRICIVMDDDIEIKKLPLFLRDIKHIRCVHSCNQAVPYCSPGQSIFRTEGCSAAGHHPQNGPGSEF